MAEPEPAIDEPDDDDDDQADGEGESDAGDEAATSAEDRAATEYAQYAEYEGQQRLWVRALTAIATMRTPDDADPCRKAAILARVAACDRIARICREDVPGG